MEVISYKSTLFKKGYLGLSIEVFNLYVGILLGTYIIYRYYIILSRYKVKTEMTTHWITEMGHNQM